MAFFVPFLTLINTKASFLILLGIYFRNSLVEFPIREGGGYPISAKVFFGKMIFRCGVGGGIPP